MSKHSEASSTASSRRDGATATTASSTTTASTSATANASRGNTELTAALSGGAPLFRQLQLQEVAGMGTEPEGGGNAAWLRAMRRGGGPTGDVVPRGAGAPLPEVVRERMERVFGHDFEHVRVHTDGAAARASEELSAHAFAMGAHIYFGAGAWAPGTPRGDQLLLHELTHVVQHDERRLPAPSPGGGLDVSSPSDPHEQEAYANEDALYPDLLAVACDALMDPVGLSGREAAEGEHGSEGPVSREVDEKTAGKAMELLDEEKLGEHFKNALREDDWKKVLSERVKIETDDTLFENTVKQDLAAQNLQPMPPEKLGKVKGITLADGSIVVHARRANLSTVVHESLHVLAHPDLTKKTNSEVEEGIVEYFTKQIMSRTQDGPNKSYPKQVAVITALADKLGTLKCEQALWYALVHGDLTPLYNLGTSKKKEDRQEKFEDVWFAMIANPEGALDKVQDVAK